MVTKPEPPLKPYHNHRNELSILNGCVVWGSHIIIPLPVRELVLKQLHDCHPGISRMKSLARCYEWWPKLDSDIKSTVRSCNIWQSNPTFTFTLLGIPKSTVEIDYTSIMQAHTWNIIFFILVDAHSKWIEAQIVPSTSSEASVKDLNTSFSTHGIPQQIVSDNGSGFISQEFSNYMIQNGIKHIHSSPYHPASNPDSKEWNWETARSNLFQTYPISTSI